jgi:uncharacterized protein (TIGR02186 family)
MMSVIRSLACYAGLLGLAAVSQAEVPALESTVPLTLDPPEVEVGVFYRGTDLQIRADIPDCNGAALLLDADGDDVTLNRKGREAGIWLNVAQITVSGAPRVYLLASSKQLDDLCPEEVQRELGLGVGSLRDRIKVTSEKPLVGSEIEEFLKLKKLNGTYRTDDRIILTPEGEGRQSLYIRLPIPATVAPGVYRVALYCFRDGGLVCRGASEISIRRVGLADVMTKLAQKHGAEYGLLAIVIAMSVGIVMGIVFHSLPGSGH